MASLMQSAAKAKGGTGGFKKPNIDAFVPPEMHDIVARVVAAGMKLMYSPDMRDELQAAIKSPDPVPKRIAENVTGLLLTLDQKSKGGIPQAALFPAAVELAGEAATVLDTAGQSVTQEDFNDALLMMFAMIGKKLGATDEELMGAAAQSLKDGGQETDDVGAASAAPPVDPASAGAPPDGGGRPQGPMVQGGVPPGPPPGMPPDQLPVA